MAHEHQLRLVSPQGTRDPVSQPPILQSRSLVSERHFAWGTEFPDRWSNWTNVAQVFDDKEYADARGQQ